jgi:hypothetical protein
LAWPAVVSEPFLENELRGQQGAAFHRLVQQYFIGIPSHLLLKQASVEPLRTWFDNFLHNVKQLPGMPVTGVRWQPEINLTDTVAGFRLMAKFDLLGIFPDGSAIIYDWKTSRSQPRHQWLSERIQTRLYRYLLVRAGKNLQNEEIKPEQVKMVYWFAEFPQQVESFTYSAIEYRQDEQFFGNTITHIAGLVSQIRSEIPGDDFPQTLDDKRCNFCVYRSLCARGVQAGIAQEMDELSEDSLTSLSDLDISLDQVAEIEY